MATSQYKEKILEKMRLLNAQLDILSEILKEVKKEEEIKNGNSSASNG